MSSKLARNKANDQAPSLFDEQIEMTIQMIDPRRIKPTGTTEVWHSVGTMGQLSPIMVRPLQNDPSYDFEIIDGGRRHNSMMVYEKSEMACIVTNGTEDSVQISAIRLVSNEARDNNPAVEARSVRELMDSNRYADEKQLASSLGLPVQTIRRNMRLARLPENMLNALGRGDLAESVAIKVANLNDSYLKIATDAFNGLEQQGKPFTNSELRRIRTRQSGDLGAVITSAVQNSAHMPHLLTIPAHQALAAEIVGMCKDREVSLTDVVNELLKSSLLEHDKLIAQVPGATSEASVTTPGKRPSRKQSAAASSESEADTSSFPELPQITAPSEKGGEQQGLNVNPDDLSDISLPGGEEIARLDPDQPLPELPPLPEPLPVPGRQALRTPKRTSLTRKE